MPEHFPSDFAAFGGFRLGQNAIFLPQGAADRLAVSQRGRGIRPCQKPLHPRTRKRPPEDVLALAVCAKSGTRPARTLLPRIHQARYPQDKRKHQEGSVL